MVTGGVECEFGCGGVQERQTYNIRRGCMLGIYQLAFQLSSRLTCFIMFHNPSFVFISLILIASTYVLYSTIIIGTVVPGTINTYLCIGRV